MSSKELRIDTNQGTITVSTENNDTVGEHTATVKCILADYPVIEYSVDLTITIKPSTALPAIKKAPYFKEPIVP